MVYFSAKGRSGSFGLLVLVLLSLWDTSPGIWAPWDYLPVHICAWAATGTELNRGVNSSLHSLPPHCQGGAAGLDCAISPSLPHAYPCPPAPSDGPLLPKTSLKQSKLSRCVNPWWLDKSGTLKCHFYSSALGWDHMLHCNIWGKKGFESFKLLQVCTTGLRWRSWKCIFCGVLLPCAGIWGVHWGTAWARWVRPHWNINPSSCQDWPASNKACRVIKYSGFLFTMCWRAEGWPCVRLHTLPRLGLPTQQSSHGAGDCFSHLSQCKLDPTGSFVKIHCKLNKGCWKPEPLLLGKKIAFPGKLDFANLWALHWESPLATHRPAKLN